MSSLPRHPAYLLIEDQLDAIGQRYRVQRIVRGVMLFVVWAIVACVAGAILADRLAAVAGGPSHWLRLVQAVWMVWLMASGLYWVARPLILRPRPLEVAQLVETRVPGLHNGLTNSLLLARRDDLANSPWLPPIFQEILGATHDKPLAQAVRFSDLRPMGVRLAFILVPILVLALVPSLGRILRHGWSQMLHPTAFVPAVGLVRDIEVQPGDITLVCGQPLEVTIIARGGDANQIPDAALIFAGAKLKPARLLGSAITESSAAPGVAQTRAIRYSYRVEHVDAPMQYRVEVAGTQSPFFSVNIVRQVKLQQLNLEIAAPAYTRLLPRSLVLKPDELEKTPVIVLQGSRIELSAIVDVPVRAAMLQVGDTAPAAMAVSQAGQRFTGSMTLIDDADVCVLLTEGAGQIIATVPQSKWTIHVTRDMPPSIEMIWPTQDTSVAPNAAIKVHARLKDDYAVSEAQVLLATSADVPLAPVATLHYPQSGSGAAAGADGVELVQAIDLGAELRKHGTTIRVQVTVVDNRDLSGVMKDGGAQRFASQIYEIRLRDPQVLAKEEKEKTDKLRRRLLELLRQQQDLHVAALAFKAGGDAKSALAPIIAGQTDLRAKLQNTAETFEFETDTRVIQKTLMVLALNPGKEAVDLASSIATEPLEKEQRKLADDLQTRQRRIIATLESLLALLNAAPEPTTMPTSRESGQIPGKKESLEKLNEALKQFLKEEQRILDQTASLAKKPVDNFDDKDKKLMEELKLAQEKMDAFMEQKLSDFSKNAEQDMSNASLLKDLMSVYSEVTMAKDALNKQAVEIAVAAEEMGLENAKELQSNIEKWLMNEPDRQNWQQEDPIGKNDTPMPELPKELEDMVGELMEQQEDLFQEMEDANANWTDSMDKGVGWDAADGPIADMSAKGVTGNQLPNDNEMAGRSGEGRQGKSQGEFVGDSAQGKGGRNTPTRLDPTPFAKGQIKDESKDPTGGATGGGKLSGQGGAGLEGPVGPKQKEEMQRLAQKQAELRNNAERLNLQYQLSKYDNFKMLEAVGLMRRVESDIAANRYQMAMRRKDVLLDKLDTSHLLLDGRIHVQQDTTPSGNARMEQEINDAMKGELPAAWTEALKQYYKKLAAE